MDVWGLVLFFRCLRSSSMEMTGVVFQVLADLRQNSESSRHTGSPRAGVDLKGLERIQSISQEGHRWRRADR